MPDPTSLEHLYDPEVFRTEGHKLVDALADSLKQSLAAEGPARPFQDPDAAVAEWAKVFNSGSSQSEDLFARWIEKAIKSHHPHTMGHQVGVTAPTSALADLLGSLLDTGNGVFEVGNPATAIERVIVKDLARRMNLGSSAGGYLTSGGTLGNLTAMLAARQATAPFNAWKEGNDSSRPLGVLVSDQAHYCIDRAARVMGWGERGVIQVATDDQSHMRASAMQTALDRAQAGGINVIAAVGNACTTATGAFDPLDEIAKFCEQNDLWFHVDAAHGGGVVFSSKHRHLLNGIEHADSVVIDFHKLMLTPALTTAVLFKDEASSFGAFAQQADYLWQSDDSDQVKQTSLPWFDSARRTMECTRPMSALRVFALLATHREEAIGDSIDVVFEAAQTFAQLITATSEFELLAVPTANIVCYRLAPAKLTQEECDALNTASRAQLIQDGNFYVVETKIDGRTWLRSAIMNPFTSTVHFTALLRALQEAAGKLMRN